MFKDNVNCKNTIFQSPILIPRNNIEKCNLMCKAEFLYPTVSRDISVRVKKMEKGNLLFFNIYSRELQKKNLADLIYNGQKYILYKIEFYSKGLHRKQNTDCDNNDMSDACILQDDLEMVFYHKSFSSENEIVAVAVPLYQMFTFSLSQDFFSRLLNITNDIENKKNLNDFIEKKDHFFEKSSRLRHDSEIGKVTNLKVCKSTCSDLDWCEGIEQTDEECYLVNNVGDMERFSPSKKGNTYTKNDLAFKEFDNSWSPFSALPNKKSFFIYKGGFPYESCHPISIKKGVTWIIMENSMPIHDTEYQTLKKLLMRFKANDGKHYKIQELNSAYVDPESSQRVVSYNDGSNVIGSNTEKDKFVVKCMKREQKSNYPSIKFAKKSDMKEKSEPELNSIIRKQTFYNENTTNSPLLTVLIWILWMFLFVGLLYFMNKNRPDSLLSIMLIGYIIYLFCGSRKHLARYLLILPMILLVVLFLFLMKFFHEMESSGGIIGKVIFGFLVISTTLSILTALGGQNNKIDVQNSFTYFDASDINNQKYYLSRSKKIILTEIIDIEKQYGLDDIHLIDFSKFKITNEKPFKSRSSNSAEIPDEEPKPYDEFDLMEFYIQILSSYEGNLNDSKITPLKAFIKAIMDNATLDTKKYYFPSSDPKTSAGVKLNWNTVESIVKYQLPETYKYLSVNDVKQQLQA